MEKDGAGFASIIQLEEPSRPYEIWLPHCKETTVRGEPMGSCLM